MPRTHEWLSSRLVEWAHRSGALPPMRITASWSRSRGSTEYKYVAQSSAPQLASALQIVQKPPPICQDELAGEI